MESWIFENNKKKIKKKYRMKKTISNKKYLKFIIICYGIDENMAETLIYLLIDIDFKFVVL